MPTEKIKKESPSAEISNDKEVLVKTITKETPIESSDAKKVSTLEKKSVEETVEETKSTEDSLIGEDEEDGENKKNAYYYAVGRRKCSVAQIRLYKKGSGEIKINEKEIEKYFPCEEWQSIVFAPLKVMGQTNKLNTIIKVQGGGVKSQSEAIRLGIARALLKLNPIFKRGLKKYGYLTRDSRVKERKKYGLKGARRAPQWAKR